MGTFTIATAAMLAATALPAAVQAQTGAAPAGSEAAVQQASATFDRCIQAVLRQALTGNSTPENAATYALAGCSDRRVALERAMQAYQATLPAAQQATARENIRRWREQLPTRVAVMFSTLRENAGRGGH